MSATNFTKGVNAAPKTVGSVLVQTKPVIRQVSIPFNFSTGTTETDVGFELPTNAVVLPEVFVLVRTAEATGTTKTLDIGTLTADSGDPDGFADGVSVAATGMKKASLASGGQTLGALLRADESGAGDNVPEADVSSGGKGVAVTPGSANFAELECDIILSFYELQ